MPNNNNTPPTFLAHATDDRAVPYQNSLIYAEQLQKYDVPYKYIQLNKGGHGFGLDLSRSRSKLDVGVGGVVE
ncbi:MAG: prolyl oligopeptidase family serine peptidase [Bacteroidia bacterium]